MKQNIDVYYGILHYFIYYVKNEGINICFFFFALIQCLHKNNTAQSLFYLRIVPRMVIPRTLTASKISELNNVKRIYKQIHRI